MVHFDTTITLGNIISLAVFVLTMAKLHMDNRERLVKIETKMDVMWRGFSRWMTYSVQRNDRQDRGESQE